MRRVSATDLFGDVLGPGRRGFGRSAAGQISHQLCYLFHSGRYHELVTELEAAAWLGLLEDERYREPYRLLVEHFVDSALDERSEQILRALSADLLGQAPAGDAIEQWRAGVSSAFEAELNPLLIDELRPAEELGSESFLLSLAQRSALKQAVWLVARELAQNTEAALGRLLPGNTREQLPTGVPELSKKIAFSDWQELCLAFSLRIEMAPQAPANRLHARGSFGSELSELAWRRSREEL